MSVTRVVMCMYFPVTSVESPGFGARRQETRRTRQKSTPRLGTSRASFRSDNIGKNAVGESTQKEPHSCGRSRPTSSPAASRWTRDGRGPQLGVSPHHRIRGEKETETEEKTGMETEIEGERSETGSETRAMEGVGERG